MRLEKTTVFFARRINPERKRRILPINGIIIAIMCLAIPYQVKSVEENKIILDLSGQERTVEESLVAIKPGDFVVVQQNAIIKKISPVQAEKILKLTAI